MDWWEENIEKRGFPPKKHITYHDKQTPEWDYVTFEVIKG